MSNSTGAMIVEKTGGPEVLEWKEIELPDVSDSQVQIRQEAIGVDFIDTQLRSGLLPLPTLPSGLGFAAAGVIEKVGKSVSGLAEGDKVVYHFLTPGAYAEKRNVPAERVFKLPDQNLDSATAAGALFRGLTAWYLATRLKDIKAGDWVLVHAAAGGVGLILCQWLAHLGAQVIGTCVGDEKARILTEYGCAHPINIEKVDFLEETKRLTDGKGVSVVYESIGKDTFEKSLDCAQRFGLVVSFGWASGDVPPVDLAYLRNKGSLFITRPTISHYVAESADFQRGASELFALVKFGDLRIRVDNRYPLKQASVAHQDLASGKTSGSVILTV
ncbi:quinone oxidoreductase family protein [Pseudomonas tolaasii]